MKERLDLISKRLYEDEFYNFMISSAFKICNEICKYGRELITFACIRGSVMEGTVTYEDDIDILINSKKCKRAWGFIEKVREKYEYSLKKECPRLKRASVISIYLPRTPGNPHFRHTLFINDPVELEIRTTHAEQFVPFGLEKNVYRFHTNYLKRIAKVALENPSIDSFRISENMRKVAIKNYNLDRDTAHSSTIITQARLIGFIFSKDQIQQSHIVMKRNKLLEEKFKEEISEITSWMGI